MHPVDRLRIYSPAEVQGYTTRQLQFHHPSKGTGEVGWIGQGRLVPKHPGIEPKRMGVVYLTHLVGDMGQEFATKASLHIGVLPEAVYTKRWGGLDPSRRVYKFADALKNDPAALVSDNLCDQEIVQVAHAASYLGKQNPVVKQLSHFIDYLLGPKAPVFASETDVLRSLEALVPADVKVTSVGGYEPRDGRGSVAFMDVVPQDQAKEKFHFVFGVYRVLRGPDKGKHVVKARLEPYSNLERRMGEIDIFEGRSREAESVFASPYTTLPVLVGDQRACHHDVVKIAKKVGLLEDVVATLKYFTGSPEVAFNPNTNDILDLPEDGDGSGGVFAKI